ncbi:MAG TPA: DUF4407 domain-containing protein, partial [Thermoanaerobaculia bacterium]|nr:DUF4407 domain-containing protein [Thermoanaerobaculia bacterium]
MATLRETLSRLFTLRPYGDHLVDGVARLWLVLASINILSIAFCDAVAWGYFAYTTAQGLAAYTAAAIAGLIVFMLVGSVDAMFVMHDRSQWRWREYAAIGARIALVILTFTVTAPFLTQLFFARDIEASILRRNEQSIAAKRMEVSANLDRSIAAIGERMTARRRDLEREIAGSGTSGRYGRGPTAAAIEREI